MSPWRRSGASRPSPLGAGAEDRAAEGHIGHPRRLSKRRNAPRLRRSTPLAREVWRPWAGPVLQAGRPLLRLPLPTSLRMHGRRAESPLRRRFRIPPPSFKLPRTSAKPGQVPP
jgi:hypothetical protein